MTSEILSALRNMDMIEHKGLCFEPIYERTNITDDLHGLFKFNTDCEIATLKRISNK